MRRVLAIVTVLISVCTAKEVRLIERNVWPPEDTADQAFAVRYKDFDPNLNPALTSDYEAQTVEDLEPIDEQCTLYKAKLTQKELYFQYIRYKVDVPDLKEFTLCIWMRSDNLSNDHTIFSYAVDGQPQEIRSWLSNSNRSSYFNLEVGGTTGKRGEESVHLFSINYPFRRRRWYHTCQSWSGITGNWLVYVEGERIGAGNSPATLGRIIRGGGVGVTGQTQHQTGGGFVEEGGVEGEVTLFKLYPSAFPKPIREADPEGLRFYRSSCDGLCRSKTYSLVASLPPPTITPDQTTDGLILTSAPPLHIPHRQETTLQHYDVTENLFEIPIPTYQPHQLNLPRQVIFQATPVLNGGVQLFSSSIPIRVARSPRRVSNRVDGLPNFESKRLGRQSFIVPNLSYAQQGGLFRPSAVSNIHQYGGSPLLRYGIVYDDSGRDLSAILNRQTVEERKKDLKPGQVADVTLAYDESIGPIEAISGGGFVRDLTPVIDWRTAPKKLYAGTMWLRANPVCRKF